MARHRHRSLRGRRARLLHVDRADPQRRRRRPGAVARRPPRRAGRAGAARCATCPGTTLECILAGCLNGFTDDEKDLLVRMSRAGNRPINWNVLGVSTLNPDGLSIAARRVRLRGRARRAGRRPHACPTPCGSACRSSREWSSTGCPAGGRCSRCRSPNGSARSMDPDVRRRLAEGAASPEAGVLGSVANWSRLQVIETFAPGEPRATRGASSVTSSPSAAATRSTCCSTSSLADDLRTGLEPRRLRRDRRRLRAARRSVARSAHRDRWVRRRRAPRHDVRRHLLDGAAQRGCPRVRRDLAGGSRPPAHRRAGPALRPHRSRPDRRRRHRRPGAVRPRRASATRPSESATTSPAARRASTPRPPASTRCSSTASPSSTTARSPARSPGTLLRSGRDTHTVTP